MKSTDSKIQIMEAMMGNRKMAKMLRDSINAPVGSTSRARAQRVFNIMHKLRANRDGAGGPGYSYTPSNPMPQNVPVNDNTPRNMVIFPSFPNLRVSLDGKGGPGFSSYVPTLSSPPILSNPLAGKERDVNVSVPSLTDLWGKFSGAYNRASQQSLLPPREDSTMAGRLFGDTQFQNIKGFTLPSFSRTQTPSGAEAPSPVGGTQTTMGSTPGYMMAGRPTVSGPFTTAPQATPEISKVSMPGTEGPQYTPQTGVGTRDGDYVYTAQGWQHQPAPGGGDTGGGTGGGDTPTREMTGVEKAVAAGLGPTGYAREEMARQGVKTLGEQFDENEVSIWDKYNIPGLTTNYRVLEYIGSRLPEVLKGYIRDNDVFLNQVDQQINGFIKDIRGQDLSNPVNQAETQSYLGYLYTLRGERNQRYIDYVNSAVDKFSDDLKFAYNVRQDAVASAEKALERADTLTSYEYQEHMTALKEQYEAVKNAPLLELQKKGLEMDILYKQAQISKTVGEYGSVASYFEVYPEFQKANILGVVKGYAYPGAGDFSRELSDLIEMYPEKGANNLAKYYTDAVLNTLAHPDGTEIEGDRLVGFYEKKRLADEAIAGFQYLAENSDVGSVAWEAFNSSAALIGEALSRQTATSLSKYSSMILDATKGLTGERKVLWDKNVTEEDFKADIKKRTGTGTSGEENVDPGIASLIYNTYKDLATGNTTPAQAIESMTTDWNTGEALSPDKFLENIMSSYVSNQYNL